MECNIYVHFEIKICGKWEHYSAPRITRCYDLFALIANVKNYNNIKPISKLKGLPDNLSIITKIEVDNFGDDGHSHTWLDAKEIKELMNTIFNNRKDWNIGLFQFGYLFQNHWGEWIDTPHTFPKEIEDIRFICWFDN